MTAEELLNKLGQVLEIDIFLNNNNVCRIVFDNDPIDFEMIGNTFTFIGEVGPIPIESRESFYALILSGNFLGQETGRATLGLDINLDAIFLHQFLELPMDYPQFEGHLEQFVNVLRFWKVKIKDINLKNNDSISIDAEFQINASALRV